MWWDTLTQGGRGNWRGNWRMECVPVLFTLPRNMVYPALLPLMRTARLPAVDSTDAIRQLKWIRPFRRKTKSGFCACAITFQTQSTQQLISPSCSRTTAVRKHFFPFPPPSGFYPRSFTRDSFTSNCVRLMPGNSVWYLCGHVYGFISA